MGLALQHVDQSLYGFLFLTSDSLRANILICKWIGQQCSKNPYASSSFPSNQYVAFLSQPSMQFCKLVSGVFQGKSCLGWLLVWVIFFYIYIYIPLILQLEKDMLFGGGYRTVRKYVVLMSLASSQLRGKLMEIFIDSDKQILMGEYLNWYKCKFMLQLRWLQHVISRLLRYTSSLEYDSLFVHYSHVWIHSSLFHRSIYRIRVLQIHFYSLLLSQHNTID